MNDKYQSFSAKISKVGINPCVDVPKKVSDAFNKRGYIPVKGWLNDLSIVATLVPVGGGKYRLYINGEMMKNSKVDVRDSISLKITFDPKPRIVPVPKELALALQKNKKAKLAFDKLAPSHRKEILTYLNWVKKTETLQRLVRKVVTMLAKRQKP
ncbi:MAG TPA: YdeI/OmpD-associated family protein [candidate division Zixibacteria bacterium]|nr:YdeI/OmpD-associated family protein [candidate division Zixibacteria bacterium]